MLVSENVHPGNYDCGLKPFRSFFLFCSPPPHTHGAHTHGVHTGHFTSGRSHDVQLAAFGSVVEGDGSASRQLTANRERGTLTRREHESGSKLYGLLVLRVDSPSKGSSTGLIGAVALALWGTTRNTVVQGLRRVVAEYLRQCSVAASKSGVVVQSHVAVAAGRVRPSLSWTELAAALVTDDPADGLAGSEQIYGFAIAQVLRRALVVIPSSGRGQRSAKAVGPSGGEFSLPPTKYLQCPAGIYLPDTWPVEHCCRSPLVLVSHRGGLRPLVSVDSERSTYAVPLTMPTGQLLGVHYSNSSLALGCTATNGHRQMLAEYLDTFENGGRTAAVVKNGAVPSPVYYNAWWDALTSAARLSIESAKMRDGSRAWSGWDLPRVDTTILLAELAAARTTARATEPLVDDPVQYPARYNQLEALDTVHDPEAEARLRALDPVAAADGEIILSPTGQVGFHGARGWLGVSASALLSTAPFASFFASGAGQAQAKLAAASPAHIAVVAELSAVALIFQHTQWRSVSVAALEIALENVLKATFATPSNLVSTDPHDVLMQLLAAVHSGCRRPLVKKRPLHRRGRPQAPPSPTRVESVVTDCFQGELSMGPVCSVCGGCSEQDALGSEPFWSFQVDIPDALPRQTIHGCLEQFFTDSSSTQWPDWQCSRCNNPRARPFVRRRIKSLPPVLVVRINRFGAAGISDGDLTPIKVPGVVDVARFMGGGSISGPHRRSAALAAATVVPYYLYGSIDFEPGSAGGVGDDVPGENGRFVARCHEPLTGEWYRYDRDQVKLTDPVHSYPANCYVLFFTAQPFAPLQQIW